MRVLQEESLELPFLPDEGRVSRLLADVVSERRKVLVLGNGGLAAESSHFVAELVGDYAFPVFIPAFDLTSNNALVTALSNDRGYEEGFVHQVKVLGAERDILVGMTTSKSPNVLKSLEVGRRKGMFTVLVCSEYRTPPVERENHTFVLAVKGDDVGSIQEEMIKLLHRLAYKAKRILSEGR